MPASNFAWPQGRRIAVAVQVMFEAWSDGAGPSYSVQTTSLRQGVRDYSNETWAQYGGRVGVWRILRLLERHGLPGTFLVSARCTELFPRAVARIASGGHEVAAHGLTQDGLLAYMSADEEREAIRRSFEALEQATGKRPEGWVTPVLSWTPRTAGYLAEAGAKWYGDLNYVDFPIRLRTASGDLIGLPVSEFTDNRLLRGNPLDLLDVYKATFDYLREHEPMSMLVLLVHCHSGGRAPVVAGLDRLFTYLRGFPDAWFATLGQVARHAADSGIEELSYEQRFFGNSGATAPPLR